MRFIHVNKLSLLNDEGIVDTRYTPPWFLCVISTSNETEYSWHCLHKCGTSPSRKIAVCISVGFLAVLGPATAVNDLVTHRTPSSWAPGRRHGHGRLANLARPHPRKRTPHTHMRIVFFLLPLRFGSNFNNYRGKTSSFFLSYDHREWSQCLCI